MSVLQCGAPKCGNFWLYKIIQQILTRDGRNTTSFIEQQPIYDLARKWDLNFPEQARIDVLEVTDLQYSYRISSIFRMPIEDIRSYVSSSPHTWTHSPVCKRTGQLLPLYDKKIYIVRDPRDRIISAAKYFCSDYMLKYFPQEEKDPARFLEKHFDDLMYEWVWHVLDYLRLSTRYNIHIAFFEGFLMNFQEELAKLLQYLKIDLSPADREALEEAVSFKTLKKKNPDHLKKGRSGYWRDVLTDEQADRAAAIAGPLVSLLGYPMHKNAPMTYASEIDLHQAEFLKEIILQHQEQLN